MRGASSHLETNDAVPHAGFKQVWPTVFTGCSGLMGGAGVVTAAAGSHTGGGELARTAADFLMIHAAVILAASVLAALRQGVDLLLGLALAFMTIGSILFSGELALAGLAGWRPIPLAAPLGGSCLILGWLLLTVFAIRACFLDRRPRLRPKPGDD